jgi:deoxyribose-phosphate aldolase
MPEKIEDIVTAVSHAAMPSGLARTVLPLIDLTSLNETDTPEIITALCRQAIVPGGHVAAVCVYPQFVALCARELAGTLVRIATVANFPHGNDHIDNVLPVIAKAVRDGAHEIDVVFPYGRYLAQDKLGAQDFIRQCKAACGEKILLKVILETGAISDTQLLADMAQDAVLAGADFLKTSTGKISIGATLPAAAILLMTIKNMRSTMRRAIGFKAAGGVRTLEQASQYLELAYRILGKDWVTPATFRLGASQLIQAVVANL